MAQHPPTPGQPTSPAHVLRYVARSDRGLIRATNQDSVFAGDRLLVIADGMGGHAAGDTASRLVVAAFAPLNDRAPAADLLGDLLTATREGNDAIAETVAQDPDLDGMGTTVTAMLFDGARVGMAHVGDSRAYLYRSGVLHQLTHDDTFVQSLVDDGRITEDEASHHPQRNLLLRALNGTDLDPGLALREVRAGDRYLLCSDGLSGVVDAETIADTLADPDPERAADVLIQRALLRGGPDNVTVIVADVVDTGLVPVPGPVTVSGSDDPEATGPIQQLTREMPRVPLPPIPEVPAARAEILPPGDETDDEDTDLDFDAGPGDEDDEQAVSDGGRPAGVGADGGDERSGAGGGGTARPDGDRRGAPAGLGHAPSDGRRRERLRWHRRGALLVAIIALIGVALGGSALWVRSQYYVGEANGLVAVFRGVNGSLLGVRFSSFQENSCYADGDGCRPLHLSDLQPAARHQVQAGIQATSLTDARDVMDRLSGELLPICPSATASPSGPSTGSQAPSSDAPPASDEAGASGQNGSPDRSTARSRAGSPTRPPTTARPSTGTSSTTAEQKAERTERRSAANAVGPVERTTPPTDTTSAMPETATAGQSSEVSQTTSVSGTPASVPAQSADSPGYAPGSIAGPVQRYTVTVAPTPTTMTVRTTVTARGPGLRAAVNGARAPTGGTAGARTTDPTGASGDATASADQITSAEQTTVTAATPTITVTQTITAGPTVTATPLAPAPAVPGVTCRIVG